MKLTKFRIQNYKSIIDSRPCEPASDLTILIGKNESGKSTVLEALRDFDKSVREFSPDVYPLDGRIDEPMVEMHFQVTRKDLDKIQEDAGLTLNDETAARILRDGWGLTKNGRGQYAFTEEYLQQISPDQDGQRQSEQDGMLSQIRSAKDRLFELLQGHNPPDVNLETSPEDIQRASREIVKNVKAVLPHIADEGLQQRIVEHLRGFIKEVEAFGGIQKPERRLFIDYVIDHLPRFVFFNEFSDVLPFEIPVEDIKKNRAVCDFAKIARLNLDKVIEITDVQKRINLLGRHSAAISGDFLNYWEQNKVEIVVKPESDKILFGIRDCETTSFYKMEQRSKGFQWFLSFYLRLQTEAGPNKIILIDEPGTNLHAKAQQEIIRVLMDKIVPMTQVIFSTHSPYLIDSERFDRIRLVLKEPVSGTVLRPFAETDADPETLIPLMTVRGAELCRPEIVPGSQSVIFQNAAMFYYIKALNLMMPDSRLEAINFIPGTGTDQIVRLASLLIGQGVDFIILLEATMDGRQTAQTLKDKFGLEDAQLVFISPVAEFLTEDLFSRNDFNKFILGDHKNTDPAVSNSRFMQQNRLNRVLTSKSFLDRALKDKDGVTLSDEAIKAFLNLCHDILVGLREIVPVEETPAEEPAAVAEEPLPETPPAQETAQKEEAEQEPEPPPVKRRSFFGLRI